MADEKPNFVDDIFDDDVDENLLASKEWNKLQEELQNGGYREGIASGKESRLQDGFNDGFTDAAKTIFLLAKERGKISAKMAFQVEGETIGDLQQTLDDIRKQELDLINAAKSKSMEDLQRIETTTQSS